MFTVGYRVGADAKQVDFYHGSTLRGERGNLLNAFFLRPSKLVDVLILLLQGGDIDKRLEGTVKDSSRILYA